MLSESGEMTEIFLDGRPRFLLGDVGGQWSSAGTYDRIKPPIATQAVSLQLPDPEDPGDVFVDEGLQRLTYLIKAKRGSQFSSTLLVHGLGRILVRNEAFLIQVVSVTTVQVELSVSCHFLGREP